jgi:hypothetical protein
MTITPSGRNDKPRTAVPITPKEPAAGTGQAYGELWNFHDGRVSPLLQADEPDSSHIPLPERYD